MPDPDAYAAATGGGAPAWSASDGGAPSTVTFSEKPTRTWIASPMPYAPVAFGDETRSTAGAAASTTMLVEPLSDSGPRGGGRYSAAGAALPEAAVIMPPLGNTAAPRAYPRPSALSPARTTYANASAPVPLPDSYTARAPGPALSSMDGGGAPAATRTGSLNETVMLMRAPAAYTAAASGEVTLSTCAPDVSIAMPAAAAEASDPAEPGGGSVRLAALPAASTTALPPSRSAALPA